MDNYSLILNSPAAMASVLSVLAHNAVNVTEMTDRDKIDAARSYSAPCRHDFDKPYGPGTRKCKSCGGLQFNGR